MTENYLNSHLWFHDICYFNVKHWTRAHIVKKKCGLCFYCLKLSYESNLTELWQQKWQQQEDAMRIIKCCVYDDGSKYIVHIWIWMFHWTLKFSIKRKEIILCMTLSCDLWLVQMWELQSLNFSIFEPLHCTIQYSGKCIKVKN